MLLLISGRGAAPSGRRLAAEAGMEFMPHSLAVRSLSNASYKPFREADMIFIWGASAGLKPLWKLKDASLIRYSHAPDKVKFRRMLSRRKLLTWGEINYDHKVRLQIPKKFPIYIRGATHRGGNNLVFAENYAQFDRAVSANKYAYWTEAVEDPDRREYRVHVINGKVIHRQRKFFPDEAPAPGTEADRVRNFDNGWRYNHLERMYGPAVALARDIMPSSMWGAVDIIRYGDTVKVLEVNTAPGLDHESTLKAWADAFRKMAS